jgi:CHASE3 domain sensor protein
MVGAFPSRIELKRQQNLRDVREACAFTKQRENQKLTRNRQEMHKSQVVKTSGGIRACKDFDRILQSCLQNNKHLLTQQEHITSGHYAFFDVVVIEYTVLCHAFTLLFIFSYPQEWLDKHPQEISI